eukprot:6076436-Karenia_brevis.AAC.1
MSSQVLARFNAVGCSRPLAHYSAGNMLWSGFRSRPLNADEEEILQGYPVGYTKTLTIFEDRQTSVSQARRSAIGN